MVKSATQGAQQQQQHGTGLRGPIDMDHLGRQSLGDPGLQEEVLRLYRSMSLTYLERLEASTTAEELLRHLHTLRGAAGGIGAVRVRDLAAGAETQLRAGTPVNPEWIEDIALAVHECVVFIDELLDAEAA